MGGRKKDTPSGSLGPEFKTVEDIEALLKDIKTEPLH